MNIAVAIQGFATLMWLVTLGLLGLAVFNAARGRRFAGGAALVVGATVIAAALSVVGAGIVFIEPNERGVVISPYDPKGYRDAALTPGLRWIIPGERVQTYSISQDTYTMSSVQAEGQVAGDDSVPARTKDGQVISIDASVLFSVDPDKVIQLHISLQSAYVDRVVRPQARSIIRDVVSQYGVEEVVSTKRAEMEEAITAQLTEKFAENNLRLADFLVRNIAFSDEYAAAVEQKQIAEQLAQQAAFVVEQRKQEAEQARQVAQGQADAAVIAAQGAAEARIIQAQAEAEALALISAALKDNPDLITYQYVTKLSPNVQVIYLPAGQQYLIPLPTPSAPTVTTPEPTAVPTTTP
jgi:regulator of protease activity HflC (stomatin/prohibitin superfamily)